MKRIYKPTGFSIQSELGIVDGSIEMIAVNKDLRLALQFNDNIDDQSNYSNVPLASSGVAYVAGKIDKALKLTGSTGYIKYDSSAIDLDVDKAFTISAWISTINNGQTQSLISNYDSTSDIKGIFWYTKSGANTFIFYLRGVSGSMQLTYNFNFAATTDLTLFTLTYDGSGNYATGLKLYKNGVDITSSCTLSDTTNGTSFKSTDPLYIANRYNQTSGWSGVIDDFRLYSKALTQTEIDEIYNSGAGSEEYRHEAGLFNAIANEQSDITYFKQWTEAVESAENSDITYTLLEDDGREYYWNGTELVKTDGTNRNTISELDAYIQSRDIRNIRPVIYFNSTGTNNPKFIELDCSYSFEPSKKFELLQDDNSVQVQAYYTDEKKFLQISYEATKVSDADDIKIRLENEDGETALSWEKSDVIIDTDDDKSMYFNLDLTDIAVGVYTLVIELYKGGNFLDIAKNIRLAIME